MLTSCLADAERARPVRRAAVFPAGHVVGGVALSAARERQDAADDHRRAGDSGAGEEGATAEAARRFVGFDRDDGGVDAVQ